MSRAVDRAARSPERPARAGARSRCPLVYRHASSRYSTVHLAFDIFQGIGVAAAVGIRPFLPALAVGALAAGDVEIHFKGTRLLFPPGRAVPARDGRRRDRAGAGRAAARRRAARDAVRSRSCSPRSSMALGALLFAGALCRRRLRDLARAVGGVRVRGRSGPPRPGRCCARVRARLDADAAGALPLFAEGAALAARGAVGVAPPVGPIALALLLWLLLAGRRRDGAEVRRAADPALTAHATKKLVLVVIDALKPSMLERAIASGRAPALRADPAGGRVRRRLRGRVPVGDAGVRGDDHDRRRTRPAPDPEHELVPPRGGRATSSTARASRPAASSACCAR